MIQGLPTHLTKQMREFLPILEMNGYEYRRCNGSHFMFVNTKTRKTMTVNKDLNKIVRRKLIREYKLEVC